MKMHVRTNYFVYSKLTAHNLGYVTIVLTFDIINHHQAGRTAKEKLVMTNDLRPAFPTTTTTQCLTETNHEPRQCFPSRFQIMIYCPKGEASGSDLEKCRKEQATFLLDF